MLGFIVSLSVVSLEAKMQQAEPENMKKKISADVTEAAKKANIVVKESLIEAFVCLGLSQIDDYRKVYTGVTKNHRVARLAEYLDAKYKIKGIPENVTSDNLNDFHWGYLKRDTGYSPFRLVSPEMAVLTKVEFDGGHYNFSAKGKGIRPGATILLPKVPGQKNTNVCAAFELGDQKALWTGYSTLDKLKVAYAETSKGCEIYVNSKPRRATVYFNNKKWYAATDTSSVRTPGSWEVIVDLEGYKKWSKKRSLLAGESWTINALLIKK